jgi:hypothetical protein
MGSAISLSLSLFFFFFFFFFFFSDRFYPDAAKESGRAKFSSSRLTFSVRASLGD